MKKEERSFGRRFVAALIAAGFLAFTVLVFAPFDLYMANINQFNFSIGDVAPAFLLLFAGLTLILSLLLALLRGALHDCAVSVVFSLGLGLYLQGNYMNPNYGTLTGVAIDWSQYSGYALINTAVWALLIAAPLVVYKFWRRIWVKIVRLVPALLVAMQLLTMVMLPMTAQRTIENNVLFSTDGMFTASKEKNVVVFLLDYFDNDYIDEVLKSDPEFLDDLEGFTYYPNTTGVHSRTCPSTSQYLAGDKYKFDIPYGQYLSELWSENEFTQTLKDSGFDVRLYGESAYMSKEAAKTVDNLLLRDDLPIAAAPLVTGVGRFVAFRYLPHLLKPYVWFDSQDFQLKQAQALAEAAPHEYAYYSIDDFKFHDQLTGQTLSASSDQPAFRFYHLYGTHPKYVMNERLERVEDGSLTVADPAKGSLNIVKEYLRQLKAAGIYEDATIIITSDHGDVFKGELNKPTNPILFVKRAGQSGLPCAISNAPAWMDDLRATILDDLRIESAAFGTSIFELKEDDARERYFYQTQLGDDGIEQKLVEYRITGDANDFANWQKTGNEWEAKYHIG